MTGKELRETLKVEIGVIDTKISNLKVQKNIILNKLEELDLDLSKEMRKECQLPNIFSVYYPLLEREETKENGGMELEISNVRSKIYSILEDRLLKPHLQN